MRMIQRLHEAMNELKWSPQPRITVEVALLSLCRPEAAPAANVPAAQAGRQEDARIAQLEAKLAQVTAALASAPASTAVGAVRPQPARAAAAQPAVSVPSAAPAPSMPVPQEPTAEGSQLWQSLLQTLKERKKTPVLACVEKGEFRGMNGTQFFLVFKSSFLKSRTERADYRELLESILAEITGKTLQVICTLEKAAPPPPPPKPKKKAPVLPPEPARVEVDLDNLSKDELASLEVATAAFGDHFVDMDEE